MCSPALVFAADQNLLECPLHVSSMLCGAFVNRNGTPGGWPQKEQLSPDGPPCIATRSFAHVLAADHPPTGTIPESWLNNLCEEWEIKCAVLYSRIVLCVSTLRWLVTHFTNISLPCCWTDNLFSVIFWDIWTVLLNWEVQQYKPLISYSFDSFH